MLWSGAALLMLLMLTAPALNVLALLLMMVPYVVLYSTLTKKAFFLHLLPVWMIAGLVAGPAVLIIGLFFILPSILMGHLYRKRASAAQVLRTVTLTILGQLLLELFLFELIFDLSLMNELASSIRLMLDSMLEQNLLAAGWDDAYTELLIQTVTHMIPLTFIVLSFILTVLTHYIARRVVNGSGMNVGAFAQAKDWRLPRVLVVYYLIVYVINLFMKRGDDSFLAVALMNLVPLLGYVFAIQAIGFFFFIAHEKKWNKVVPILIAVPVLLIPPLSLIGVLDTAFPIRKSFTKQQ